MLSEKIAVKILTSLNNARLSSHRRLIVLTGSNYEKSAKIAAELVRLYVTAFKPKKLKVLYTYHSGFDDAHKRRRAFKDYVKSENLSDVVDVDYVPYPETVRVLGTTYDIAILDLINNLKPNDLGRLVGIVRGGGFLVFLLPPFDVMLETLTRFQENLLTIGYTASDVRQIFKRRFIKKLFEHDGIMIYDVDNDRLVKEIKVEHVVKWTRKRPEIPPKPLFPRRAYSMALTQDQVEVLKLLEELYERPEAGEKYAIVITADRGRGKSCAVGIGIAALAHKLRRAKGRTRILVTAPSETNVQSLFELARLTLEKLDYRVEVKKVKDFVVALKCKGIDIEYYPPLEALHKQADIIAVDEAAGLQVPMLFGIHKRFDRMIFSSTIHGYEGAGRGFSVRFLQLLRRDPKTKVYEYEMEEPIRYAPNDPIEKWLFDTLLLDAEPAALDENDDEYVAKCEVVYVNPDPEEFFLKQEDLLRQFIGIYIMAHYRNNPDDVGMMMDAPHHEVRYLKLPTEKIVTSVELAKEGGIPKPIGEKLAQGEWVPGNIIPDRYIKHYRVLEFGELVGWRIVRIATHPSVQGRGLGSKMLEYLCKEAESRGYDWIGAGFGVNYELLRFWIKNGFIPIHISPERNPVSGEYTVIVVKPLNEKARKFVEYANKEFRLKLLYSLHEPYHDLSPRVARLLLKDWGWKLESVKLDLTPSQKGRLISYAWELMTIENCFDVVQKIVRYYFADTSANKPHLTDEEEEILIVRVLQAKSWRVSCEQLKVSPPYLMNKVRELIRRLCEHYLGATEEDCKTYFIELQ